MDQAQQTLTLEESVKQVMQTLPPPIRHYLGQGKYSEVAKNLMVKYQLHIDQGTVLEREIMLLLMGIETPDEFTQALASEGRIDEVAISSIIKDVNDQIFIPLREEMRRGEAIAQEKKLAPPPPRPVVERPSYAPPPPPRPVSPPLAPRPRQAVPPPPQPTQPPTVSIEYKPTPPKPVGPPPKPWTPDAAVFIPSNPSLPPRPPETFTSITSPRFMPPRPPAPRPAPSKATQGTAQRQAGPLSRPQAPTTKPLTESDRLLEDHEQSHIEFHQKAAPPPPNLPGVLPPSPPTPPVPTAQRPLPDTPRTSTQHYTADPYREPIEP